MITIDDIIGMADLTRGEIDTIMEREPTPEVAAAALATYLTQQPTEAETVRKMTADAIRAASERGDREYAKELLAALKHFIATLENFAAERPERRFGESA